MRCLEGEVVGHAIDQPRLRGILERAEHQGIAFATEIDAQIGVAPDGQLVERAGHRLRDHVVMLDRVERNRHAAAQAKLARPHPAGQHDILGPDGSASGGYSVGPPVSVFDIQHADVLEYLCALAPRPFGQGERHFLGNHLAIVREPGGAEDVVNAEQRPFGERGLRLDQLHFHAEPLGHCRRAAQLVHPFRGTRDDEAAHLFPAHGVAGFLLERSIQLGAVLVNGRQCVVGAQAANESSGVPGGAARQLVLLQDHHVPPAELREVVGDTRSADAAANDHDLRFGGEGWIHTNDSTPVVRFIHAPRLLGCRAPIPFSFSEAIRAEAFHVSGRVGIEQ